MAVRVSPYAISLIDWSDPIGDPIRRQFIPLASSLLPDHPRLTLDSLHEQQDSPLPGLVHRYVDKALFLPLAVCPVYCRFCTRSYAIGPDTENVDKIALATTRKQWQEAFEYIASRPELEDIVISGGDAYQLAPKNIELDRQRVARHSASATSALRNQRPSDHADEAHHPHRVARRADLHRGAGPKDRQGSRSAHAFQRARRDHVDHGEGDAPALRAWDIYQKPVRAHPWRQRHARADAVAGQAARPRQRALILRLHARHGQRGRGCAPRSRRR